MADGEMLPLVWRGNARRLTAAAHVLARHALRFFAFDDPRRHTGDAMGAGGEVLFRKLRYHISLPCSRIYRFIIDTARLSLFISGALPAVFAYWRCYASLSLTRLSLYDA